MRLFGVDVLADVDAVFCFVISFLYSQVLYKLLEFAEVHQTCLFGYHQ